MYVLDKTIADGKKIPRWKPRSSRQVNMGLSPRHATTVPRVLNPDTGAITPQFHVIFDDWFATVSSQTDEDPPDLESPAWTKLFGDSEFQYHQTDDAEAEQHQEQLSNEVDSSSYEHRQFEIVSRMNQVSPSLPLTVPPLPGPIPSSSVSSIVLVPPATNSSHSQVPSLNPEAVADSEGDATAPDFQTSNSVDPLTRQVTRQQREKNLKLTKQTAMELKSEQQKEKGRIVTEQSTSPKPRRSNRQRYKPDRLTPALDARQSYSANYYEPLADQSDEPTDDSHIGATEVFDANVLEHFAAYVIALHIVEEHENENKQIHDIEADEDSAFWVNWHQLNGFAYALKATSTAFAFKATASDPDTLSYDQAIHDVDHDKWMKSAMDEITALTEKETWVEVPHSEATSRIIPGTWVFRRKRSPDGTVKKHKGRYCVRGDLQDGKFETFAPVVSWSTIRTVLILSLVLEWELVCVDFSNAFVQAKLKEPVYIHLPRGFRSNKNGPTCLKLLKSLYGLSVAPRLWFEKLCGALLEDGFTQSEHDKCLFLKKHMIIFLWVDDCGICSKEMADIDAFIKRLKQKGFELTKDEAFSEYLGINFVRDNKRKTITMTQPGLIKKVIAATGMEDCNPNYVPAASATLGSDPDGEPADEKWGYSSIVGMLLYLSTNTRPDIAFSVSQVARYSSAPKKSHTTAVKTIIRYLARTVTQGIVFCPNLHFKLDCYVDADFAGLHGQEPQNNPISAKSRTGYIIFFGGCPLLWKSQIQGEVALSTFHSEYVALSQSMRTLLWLQRVIEEIMGKIEHQHSPPTVHAEAFEDNNSALMLANNQVLSPRSRHLNVKWHFFWQEIKNSRATVTKINTEDQRADFLTKGLTKDIFERIRALNQGW
jgi:hypothetical protein